LANLIRMKKRFINFSFAGSFVLVLMSVLPLITGSSCNRNKECKAIVTVLNTANAPQSGVTVELIANGNCANPPCNTIAPLTATTDGSGKASFTTDLPKIMEIEANAQATGKVVRFEEGETDEVTVIIQ
jgi:hypothetical protein